MQAEVEAAEKDQGRIHGDEHGGMDINVQGCLCLAMHSSIRRSVHRMKPKFAQERGCYACTYASLTLNLDTPGGFSTFMLQLQKMEDWLCWLSSPISAKLELILWTLT
ncbi:hypothetical protein WJX77_001323 [Trebouxia sp. C0004]